MSEALWWSLSIAVPGGLGNYSGCPPSGFTGNIATFNTSLRLCRYTQVYLFTRELAAWDRPASLSASFVVEGGGGSVVVASIAVASITGRFINRFKNESYNYNRLTDNLDKDWILVVIHNTQLRDHMQAFLFYILFPHMARFLNFSSLKHNIGSSDMLCTVVNNTTSNSIVSFWVICLKSI